MNLDLHPFSAKQQQTRNFRSFAALIQLFNGEIFTFRDTSIHNNHATSGFPLKQM